MIFLQVTLAVASTVCLVSLSGYIWLAVTGKSPVLYATSDDCLWRCLPFWKKAAMACAVLGFLVCMYSGAESMLFWIPDEWGSLDEKGEWQTWRSSLSFLFAASGGVVLLQFIDRAQGKGLLLKQTHEKAQEMERIIAAIGSPERLEGLKQEYEAIIEGIKHENPEADAFHGHLLPDGRRIMIFRELLRILDRVVHFRQP